MKQSVKNLTIVGTSFNKVEFLNDSPKFLVKNFGSNPIYVSFDNEAETTESIKINADYYQVIDASFFVRGTVQSGAHVIYIKGTANDTVEVTQIWN